jgi:hypothetical protein
MIWWAVIVLWLAAMPMSVTETFMSCCCGHGTSSGTGTETGTGTIPRNECCPHRILPSTLHFKFTYSGSFSDCAELSGHTFPGQYLGRITYLSTNGNGCVNYNVWRANIHLADEGFCASGLCQIAVCFYCSDVNDCTGLSVKCDTSNPQIGEGCVQVFPFPRSSAQFFECDPLDVKFDGYVLLTDSCGCGGMFYGCNIEVFE